MTNCGQFTKGKEGKPMAAQHSPHRIARLVLEHGRLIGSPLSSRPNSVYRLLNKWRWKWGGVEVWVRGYDRPVTGWLVWPGGKVKLFREHEVGSSIRRRLLRRMRSFAELLPLAREQIAAGERLNREFELTKVGQGG